MSEPASKPAWGGYSAEARAQAQELKCSPQFMTAKQLAEHDGTGPDSMLLLAIRSSNSSENPIILDVEAGGEGFYGPGCPYHGFTGKDASRAFSKSSIKPAHWHGDMDGATASEWSVLDEWYTKLSAKYPIVGYLVSSSATSPRPLQQEAESEPPRTAERAPHDVHEGDGDAGGEDAWRVVEADDSVHIVPPPGA